MKNLLTRVRLGGSLGILALAMMSTTAHAQAYKADFTTKVVLAGGGTLITGAGNDVVNSLTLIAGTGGAPISWVLPNSNGSSGYMLTNNGSGTLSWTNPATGVILAGDVTGAAGANTVVKINGVPLGLTTATAGNLLIGSGTDWVTNAVTGDITLSSGGVTAVNAVHTAAGSSIATAINNSGSNLINGENVIHDATLAVDGSHHLGFDLTHQNAWTGQQTFTNSTTNTAAATVTNSFGNASGTALAAAISSTGTGTGTGNTALQLTASGSSGANTALDVTAGNVAVAGNIATSSGGTITSVGTLTASGAGGLALTNATQPTIAVTDTKGVTITDGTNTLFTVTDNGSAGTATADIVNAGTGFKINNGAATAGHFLRGDNTNFVDGTIQATDIPAGSANYIQNGTSLQASSNFNVSGSGQVGTTFTAGTSLTAPTETLSATTNQLVLGGASHLLTINSPAVAAATQTYTIPDAGGAASFILSTFGSAQSIAGGLTSTGLLTASGGLTETGTALVNNSGTSATTIGNTTNTGGVAIQADPTAAIAASFGSGSTAGSASPGVTIANAATNSGSSSTKAGLAISSTGAFTGANSGITLAVTGGSTTNTDIVGTGGTWSVSSAGSLTTTGNISTTGSGTITSAGTVTAGGLTYTAQTATTLAANTDDWGLSATGSYFLISASTPVNVTGIASGSAGRIIVLVNTSANAITLNNENTGSTTAADRFHLQGASDVILAQDGTITLVYDGSASRWRMVSAQ